MTDGAQEWIVRRPPLGHVLATAHDMAREYRVISALQETAVPVPRTYAMCTDSAVLGADFYVMERCAGTPYRRTAELRPLGPERTRAISERLVDTLAALHAVEPDEVGLGDFGRPRGLRERCHPGYDSMNSIPNPKPCMPTSSRAPRRPMRTASRN